jgi:MFS family permease
MFTIAYIGDRFETRGPLIIFNCIVAIVGVSMMAFLTLARDRYAGVFLGVAAANTNVPSILSYMHNNIVGQTKRAISSALLIGGGAIGGICATLIFRQQDAPAYRPAMITVLCTQAVTVLHILKNFYIYSRKNRKADQGGPVIEGQEGFRHTF